MIVNKGKGAGGRFAGQLHSEQGYIGGVLTVLRPSFTNVMVYPLRDHYKRDRLESVCINSVCPEVSGRSLCCYPQDSITSYFIK